MRYITFICIFFCAEVFCQDTLTKAEIPIAEKMIGLTFSSSERDSMYDELKGTVKEFEKMRKMQLLNSVPLTLAFNPVLPGMILNHTQKKIKWDVPSNVSLPSNTNDLAFYSISQLASLIKNKKITSVDLTKYFVNRIKKYADSLQCVISITEELALKQAAKADKEISAGNYRGLLHGVPYGLKDLFAVKGTLTTWGAEPYKKQSIEEDAFVYTKLSEAGAVLIGKFTLGALAMGDYWYGGRTRNPWNLTTGSSGSSAGSAAATVAGLVPFAIGTETLGSIVSPSTTCGATGLRPTFGAISRTGAMALSWSMDKIGPICRSAEDAAIVFNYIHGTDGKDASAVDMPFNYAKADLKKLKIAYASNYYNRLDSVSNERAVLKLFSSLGVELIPVVFPDSGYYNYDMVGIVIGAESAAAFDEFTRSGKDDLMTRQRKGDWPNQMRAGRFIPAVEYINTNRHRYTLMQKVNELMQNYDVVIAPSFSGQLRITNLTGHPVVCVPNGFNRRNLPTSISFIGKLYDEATILAVAKAYQDATVWDEKRPPGF